MGGRGVGGRAIKQDITKEEGERMGGRGREEDGGRERK